MQSGNYDIVFLAHGRPTFTEESLRALARNTDWAFVRNLVVYVDAPMGSTDIWLMYPDLRRDLLRYFGDSVAIQARSLDAGGPVNIMLDYLAKDPSDVWAKIDNDVIVPPGWLNAAAAVMATHPELSLLGLEPPASRTKAPWALKTIPAPELSTIAVPGQPSYARCDAIGGVGLMRTSAFRGRPPMTQHSTYGGFTDWQLHADLVKGWIVPPLKLFLLDRLPIEPWLSLSKRYIEEGYQRPWTNYPLSAAADLWEWWLV